MTKSKHNQARQKNLAKARAQKSNNSTFASDSDTDIDLNTARIESQLETSEITDFDATPDELLSQATSNAPEFDDTPENLSTSAESENLSDEDYLPSTDKSMIITYQFLVNLMRLVSCPDCQKQGGLVPSVTHLRGFYLEINFVCRCKYSFCLANFPDTDINAVLIRNLISNGISKQGFQRWLQVANFGADIDGKAQIVNLFTVASAKTYKQQNSVIIEEAETLQKMEVERLHQANEPIIISTDMCYAKRGYHSPAGHAALICNKKVIDARTVKRSSNPSENAFGTIVDLPANKIEQYAVEIMIKDIIPVLGPMIKQIDVDQDASIQKVLKEMKWEPKDVQRINKWNGQPACTDDMVGKSVWSGETPEIHFDKVKNMGILRVGLGSTSENILLEPKPPL